MSIERIEPDRGFAGRDPRNTIYLAGQVASDPVGTGVTAQTQNIWSRSTGCSPGRGSDKDHILSATIYLADIVHFAEMNAAWDAWVSKEQTRRCAPPSRRGCAIRNIWSRSWSSPRGRHERGRNGPGRTIGPAPRSRAGAGPRRARGPAFL